jgi:hypothetical protein
MPVPDYSADTFVAFLDISGFKEMMKTPSMAAHALDRFYQIGYDVLGQRQDGRSVHGFFLSDCAILFVGDGRGKTWTRFGRLLTAIEQINRRLVVDRIMTTTSIAYGPFSYHQRIEFEGIEKHPLLGNAYVAAYLDNENGSPRIQPGQCRVLLDSVPAQEPTGPDASRIAPRLRSAGNKHRVFYWMVENQGNIEAFEADYRDAYKLKYEGMLDALRMASGIQHQR